MQLKNFIDFWQLMEETKSTKEERRAFSLSHSSLKDKPFSQLQAWLNLHRHSLKKPLRSEVFTSKLYVVTFVLSLLGFVLGLLSAVALLSYNGHEPVNVIYFMAMVIAIPLLTMTLTLLSMFKVNQSKSVWVHLSPSYWFEKILSWLPTKVEESVKNVKMNPLLANWIVIKRAQLVALIFSLGLFLGLLGVVSTKDIAFAWSTTLQVTPETFHTFLHTLAYPWRTWLPSAVPSLELIEQSQYFRLGDKLSDVLISNASKLGEWWKFLALATLFYAMFLRVLMYLLACFGLRMALQKSLLRLENVDNLLRDMNEPIISTHALDATEAREEKSFHALHVVKKLDSSYDVVQGWAMSQETLLVLNDSMQIIAPHVYDVGGNNTLEDDVAIIGKSHGEVLLYVKVWEPPTMDFMDYLERLASKVDKVIVLPVGTKENNYVVNVKFLSMWEKKLAQCDENKVWLKS